MSLVALMVWCLRLVDRAAGTVSVVVDGAFSSAFRRLAEESSLPQTLEQLVVGLADRAEREVAGELATTELDAEWAVEGGSLPTTIEPAPATTETAPLPVVSEAAAATTETAPLPVASEAAAARASTSALPAARLQRARRLGEAARAKFEGRAGAVPSTPVEETRRLRNRCYAVVRAAIDHQPDIYMRWWDQGSLIGAATAVGVPKIGGRPAPDAIFRGFPTIEEATEYISAVLGPDARETCPAAFERR